jgi:hypothetical protein
MWAVTDRPYSAEMLRMAFLYEKPEIASGSLSLLRRGAEAIELGLE